MLNDVQNPFDTFPRNFPVDVGVMKFGKRHHATGTTDFCPRQLVTDFLQGSRRLVTDLLVATGKLV